MEDIVKNNKFDELVRDTAQILEEHKAREIIAIDISGQNSWTDYFIIADSQQSGGTCAVF